MENRVYSITNLEIRKNNGVPRIIGHAAVFNTIVDIGAFREQILPGAFKNTLKTSDVKALFNHDPNWILGRNQSGTLKMSEDSTGLLVEITPPDTQLIRDMVLTPMERGDLSQMSFAFQAKQDKWQEENGKTPLRSIVEVDPLFDVSLVTYPAYPTTDASLRDILNALKNKPKKQCAGLLRRRLELAEKISDLGTKDEISKLKQRYARL